MHQEIFKTSNLLIRFSIKGLNLSNNALSATYGLTRPKVLPLYCYQIQLSILTNPHLSLSSILASDDSLCNASMVSIS